jgi:protein OS-9
MVIDGQRYLCSIPYVPAVVDAKTASNRTAEEEEQDLALATERGWELLRGMEGSCIYFVSGWWSYSFCYNEGVRQFHQMPPGRNVPVYPPVEDKSVSAYSLGRVQKDVEDDGMESEGQKGKALAKTKMRTKGESRYLVQHLKGGTTCDLTGQERNIEIQVWSP